MALPILNDKPKYDMVIPSTNAAVRFRPYLVREEKILMLALESKDAKHMFKAIHDTLRACVYGDIDFNSLTVFDVEYMFITIRGKSVGESSEVMLKCSICEHQTKVKIDLDDIFPNVADTNMLIQITDDISLEMQWPRFADVSAVNMENASQMSLSLEMIGNCIKYVNTSDDKVLVADETKESIQTFIDSLDTQQFQKLSAFAEGIPTISKDVNYECEECHEKHDIVLTGISDFF